MGRPCFARDDGHRFLRWQPFHSRKVTACCKCPVTLRRLYYFYQIWYQIWRVGVNNRSGSLDYQTSYSKKLLLYRVDDGFEGGGVRGDQLGKNFAVQKNVGLFKHVYEFGIRNSEFLESAVNSFNPQ